ncbi:hypothetical protein LWI28_016089 [Acer negundo]|uniref:CTLH domain-containing protein n=1 Tax=Acer negundo TaxID=4023 RepID=A0AAD5NUU3_ACENE|nr:hypothetical protein LWI28_016089 [Acer negundo]
MCIDKTTNGHLIILILKFLEEQNCKESVEALEQESKVFFNLNHFGETIMSGEWEKAEKYLSAFTKLADNRHSKKLFFELQKQKYFEALDREDHAMAINIFENELKLFSVVTLAELLEELIYLILQFLDEENFKETLHKLELETKVYFDMDYVVECMINRKWGRAEKYLSAFTKMDDNRYSMDVFSRIQKQKHFEALDRQEKHPSNPEKGHECDATILKMLLEENPILQEKLKFPSIDKSRLKKLIKQAMEWWIPHFAYMKHNASNQTISLKGIPTVPDLFHAPASC